MQLHGNARLANISAPSRQCAPGRKCLKAFFVPSHSPPFFVSRSLPLLGLPFLFCRLVVGGFSEVLLLLCCTSEASFAMSCVRQQSFTAEQKLKIIAVAKEIGNRAAGRRHDVDESCIRQWRALRQRLKSANRDSRSCHRPKTGTYPQLKIKLTSSIEERCDCGLAMSTKMTQLEALRLTCELDIPDNQFRASHGWLQRFIKCQGF